MNLRQKLLISNHNRESSSCFILSKALRICLTEEEFKLVQAQLGFAFLNFKKDNGNIIHSQYNQWQSLGGYIHMISCLVYCYTMVSLWMESNICRKCSFKRSCRC